jgi:hypothetical protein
MSDVPVWIQVLQGLSTPAIALGGGLVAYRQWRIAHTKILLDLFDKRLGAYNDIIGAMRPVFRDGTIDSYKDFIAFRRSIDSAYFLFGDEVRVVLNELILVGSTMVTASSILKDPGSPQYSLWVDKNHAAFERLMKIADDLPDLMDDYLGFADKRIPTFSRRLKDRNKIRLSYADEKQR